VRALPLALAALLTLPGCITPTDLIIAASAPKSASGMTIFLAADKSVLARLSGGNAEYVIYYGDQIAYPPAGKGGTFEVSGRTGNVFVPYDHFVVGNGEYDVLVRYAGVEARSRVHVDKWVSYVYLHPFDRGDHVTVEAALQSASGGNAEDRVLAEGELVLTLKYHGKDGTGDVNVAQFSVETSHGNTATDFDVDKARFDQGAGWYSFEAVFHNHEAVDNVQVPPDPAMSNSQPPFNWISIS
jgi:hypothetical protein